MLREGISNGGRLNLSQDCRLRQKQIHLRHKAHIQSQNVYNNENNVQAVIGQNSFGTLKTENDSTLTRLCGVGTSEMDKEERKALLNQISPVSHVDESDPPFYLEPDCAEC